MDYCFKDRSGFFLAQNDLPKQIYPIILSQMTKRSQSLFGQFLSEGFAVCDTIYGSFGDGQNYITIFRWINLREDHIRPRSGVVPKEIERVVKIKFLIA